LTYYYFELGDDVKLHLIVFLNVSDGGQIAAWSHILTLRRLTINSSVVCVLSIPSVTVFWPKVTGISPVKVSRALCYVSEL